MFRTTLLARTVALPTHHHLLVVRHASVLTNLHHLDVTSPPPPPSSALTERSPPAASNRARVTLFELRKMLDTARNLVQQLERRQAQGESGRLQREMERFMEEQREAMAKIEGAIAIGQKKGKNEGGKD